MKHGFHVIVDDMRDLGCEIVLRTSQSAVFVLAMLACRDCPVEILYLDHDLGPCSETDGYELLKTLNRLGLRAYKKIGLVSSNPPGRANQAAFLRSQGYVEEGGFFILEE